MAMQDTCRETVDELIIRFQDYIEDNYDDAQWDHYVTAILALAEIEFSIMEGGPFFFEDGRQAPPPKKSPRLKAIDFVLQNMLAPADSNTPRPEAIILLANIAKRHEGLRTAITDLHSWRTSEWGIQELLSSTKEKVSIRELYEAVV